MLFRRRLISSGEGKKRISLIIGFQEFWVCRLEPKLLVVGRSPDREELCLASAG